MPIYRKTDAGRTAVETRQAGLSALQRRLLILIDGRRDLAELQAMLQLPTLLNLMTDLLSQGLIEDVCPTASQVSAQDASKARLAAIAEPQVPAPGEVEAASFPPGSESCLAEVVALIVSSSREHAGLHGEEIARLAQGADSPERLRRCLARWKLVLQESRGGVVLADDYFSRAQKILHRLALA